MILEHGESYRTDLIVTMDNGIKRSVPVIFTKKGNKLWLQYGFNKKLTDDLKKCMSGMKWHGFDDNPVKQWSCDDNFHNWFQIEFMEGKNPYFQYDIPLIDIPHTKMSDGMITMLHSGRNVYPHQYEFIQHFITRHYAIIAGEMGTGKTLSAMEAMEISGVKDWLWVGPASALNSVKLEFKKWNSKVNPTFVTCSSLEKYANNWTPGRLIHQGVVFDESARFKTPTAQRSKAAMYIADAIRREHGPAGYVIEMSGAPAPKTPVDWYHQCEIARPGYIMEGDIHKFTYRLAIVVQKDNGTGGVYPERKAWRDNELRCDVCGEGKDSIEHSLSNLHRHDYKKCVNEVSNLYKRMQGLVIVKTKKECLNLPDKIYKVVQLPPTTDTLRAARLLVKKSSSTIKALTHLRELSDGFLYEETEKGKQTCPLCEGTRTTLQDVYCGPAKTFEFMSELGLLNGRDFVSDEELESITINSVEFPNLYKQEQLACQHCDGVGEIKTYERTARQLDTPKEQYLRDLLDEHEDVGRLVVFAGFMGSVDRCIEIAKSMKWEWIAVDGRGYRSSFNTQLSPTDLLNVFQEKLEEVPRVVFIGNPEAAGTGLTLTKSPTILYYSNTFSADARMQSEDRIHRISMDVNKGATIIDLIHLPSDQLVLENLRKKKELQDISLGQLEEAIYV